MVVERQAKITTDTVEYTCGVNYAGTWQTNSIVIDVFGKIVLCFLFFVLLPVNIVAAQQLSTIGCSMFIP